MQRAIATIAQITLEMDAGVAEASIWSRSMEGSFQKEETTSAAVPGWAPFPDKGALGGNLFFLPSRDRTEIYS